MTKMAKMAIRSLQRLHHRRAYPYTFLSLSCAPLLRGYNHKSTSRSHSTLTTLSAHLPSPPQASTMPHIPLLPKSLPHPPSSTPQSPVTADLLTVFSPAALEPVYTLPLSSPNLSNLAQAQQKWGNTPRSRRLDLLSVLHTALLSNMEPLAQILSIESASPLSQARAEVQYAASFFRYNSHPALLSYASQYDPSRIVAVHPIGAVYAITPFNLPLALLCRKLAPALAAGCVVVAKVSERTPLSSLAFQAIARECGLPGDVFQVVVTDQPGPITDEILACPSIRKLTFTGSTRVGKLLMAKCAERLVRVSLELGGNAPAILFADANLDLAVRAIVNNKMRRSGQTCIAVNRIFAHRNVVDSLSDKLKEAVGQLQLYHGDGGEGEIGALMHGHVGKVNSWVRESETMGATIVLGGESNGNMYPATLITDVTDDMPLFANEVFAPVFSVATFTSEDEVVTRANERGGLASYVFTADQKRGMRVAQSLYCGMVGVNDTGLSNAHTPFGGWGESGVGREGGVSGVAQFQETKFVLLGE